MIDDATVYRLGQDNFRFVGGDEYDGVWLQELAERDGLKVLGEAVDRSAPQRRGPGAGEPRAPAQARLDAADADLARGSALVPLHDRQDRRRTTASRSSSPAPATRASWATRSGATPPTVPRSGTRSRSGRGSRPDPARARGARHAPDRVRPHLRRLRVRRPGRPVRGGHRLRGRPRDRGRLRRARSARGATGASAARPRRPRARRERDRRARRRRLRRAAARRRRHERDAKPDPPAPIALARVAVQYAEPGPRWRWASSTVCRSASRRRSSGFPFYDPEKTRPRS